jgi:hypothetical protein
LTCPMPGEKLFLDRLDLQSELHQLRDERPKSYARQSRKINRTCAFAEDSLDQCTHMPDALRDHDPELRKMRPERVCQHRLLPDQQRPCAMEHENGLLVGALDRDKPHVGRRGATASRPSMPWRRLFIASRATRGSRISSRFIINKPFAGQALLSKIAKLERSFSPGRCGGIRGKWLSPLGAAYLGTEGWPSGLRQRS